MDEFVSLTIVRSSESCIAHLTLVFLYASLLLGSSKSKTFEVQLKDDLLELVQVD